MRDAKHRRDQEGVRQQAEEDERQEAIRVGGDAVERTREGSALLV